MRAVLAHWAVPRDRPSTAPVGDGSLDRSEGDVVRGRARVPGLVLTAQAASAVDLTAGVVLLCPAVVKVEPAQQGPGERIVIDAMRFSISSARRSDHDVASAPTA